MPEAKFVLKEPKSAEKTLVYLFYNYNSQRLKYSTGEKISPKYWNAKKQRAKETSQFPEYPELNQRLNNIETSVNTCYRRLRNDGNVIITPELLRKELTSELKTEKITAKPLDLIEWINNEIILQRGIKKEATIKTYKTLLNHLKEFSRINRCKLSFESIDLNFYMQFVKYMQDDKRLLNNTCGKHLKTLKFFLGLAEEKGINFNSAYKGKSFKIVQETVNHIYLTEQELQCLYGLDLSHRLYLDRVRDLFLIGCHTGLRFSDFTQLKPENLQKSKSGYVFNVRTEKTNERVVIPVKSVVKNIWDKYDGRLPRAISNQKMNDYLKELGKIAGININTIIKKTSGNDVREKICPKYELITTHTARRSFATNAYLCGIPAISIMKFTGHRTESSFMKYIKVSQERNAELLSNHEFFK